ncbi:MAG TPA: CoA pyrophosphatase [Anaerolineales bacterium]|nr:CoA pyrophosphatase [Anaerolineales bacterium]
MPFDLSAEFIADRLKRAYQPGVIASTDGYASMYENVELKCAAVLIPLAWEKDEWKVVLTRRTDTVEHHKGQVSFPGGGCDLADGTAESTALREAQEEVGLDPAGVRVLGRLNDVLTITRYRVTPVVGIVPWPYALKPAPAEVERVFTIPLLWLAERKNWEERFELPDGTPRPFPVILYHLYDGELLWGASARMAQNFLSVLGLI